MRELNSHDRKFLSSKAQTIKPVVQVGQNGFTENLTAQVEQMLEIHELIKIKFNDFKDEKHEISEKLAKQTKSDLVRVIGNTAIFYRPAKDAEKRKYGIV